MESEYFDLQIFKLTNQNIKPGGSEYYSDILIVAETGFEAKELSISKYNPDREPTKDWSSLEEDISCEEIGIPFSDFKKGDVIVECFVKG